MTSGQKTFCFLLTIHDLSMMNDSSIILLCHVQLRPFTCSHVWLAISLSSATGKILLLLKPSTNKCNILTQLRNMCSMFVCWAMLHDVGTCYVKFDISQTFYPTFVLYLWSVKHDITCSLHQWFWCLNKSLMNGLFLKRLAVFTAF